MISTLVLTLAGMPRLCVANDWMSADQATLSVAACDLNGDGLDDCLALEPDGKVYGSLNVKGWKAAGWGEVYDAGAEKPFAMLGGRECAKPDRSGVVLFTARGAGVVRAQAGKLVLEKTIAAAEGVVLVSMTPTHALKDAQGKRWVFTGEAFVDGGEEPALKLEGLDGPPYEPGAAEAGRFAMDLNGDGIADAGVMFRATMPHAHAMIRVALATNPDSKDQDSDGLTDDEERAIGSDPLNRDTDQDGLLDGWEVKGLPRGIALGDIGLFDAANPKDATKLSPLRQDVIVSVARYEQLKLEDVQREIGKAAGIYARCPNKNPDGSTGIFMHFRVEPEPVLVAKQHGGSWGEVGNERFLAREHGFMHWMQVTPGGGGQAAQTGNMGGSGCHWAAFAHEVGHQLSLSHEGDSAASWCPLYPSLMNYAFNYGLGGDGNAIRFSDGKFRDTVLDEHHLIEHLPYAIEDLKYLEAPPFRFRLEKDPAGGTFIDWNQNGVFDKEAVTADINYGGSTYGGTRRDHEYIGAAPSLAYVDSTCYVAFCDQTMDRVSVKRYLGEEKWGEARVVATSPAVSEPVLVGGADAGALLVRQVDGWKWALVTEKEVGGLAALNVPRTELGAGRVDGRVLLVSRFDDNHLEARWMEKDGAVSSVMAMNTQSQVAPAIVQDGAGGRICLVTSLDSPHGGKFCMRVTELTIENGAVKEGQTRWTRGEKAQNHCLTRPAAGFTPGHQLVIFHLGWPGEGGQSIAYRTLEVANKALDDGWLTSMMYDIWTRTRVSPAFAIGAQGAIYAFRWDSGDYRDWLRNRMLIGHNGLGIDDATMRDFDDVAKISRWGIRHSILTLQPE